MGPRGPFISFLSDYGLDDEFVGVCHGVIARRCPAARVIDLTHAIPPQDVRTGAIVLRDSVGFMPPAVHLAIVDPGVGATGQRRRRAVALRAAHAGHCLVGPDNGLLMPAIEALGGVLEAYDVDRSAERLSPVSRTFHGRDIFAPVAAALADGASLAEVGERLDPSLLTPLALPCAELSRGALLAHVLRVDRFGNVMLDATLDQLRQLGLRRGRLVCVEGRREQDGNPGAGRSRQRRLARLGSTFSEVAAGELLLYEDSRAMLALAVNEGSAAGELQLRREDELRIGPAEQPSSPHDHRPPAKRGS